MRKTSIFSFALLAIIGLIVGATNEREYYQLIKTETSFIVRGTASSHNWKMEGNEATGKATSSSDSQNNKRVHSIEILIPAKSLKSGKDGMDNNAYEALKANSFPYIKFELKEAVDLSNTYWVPKTIDGYLTIAGEKRYTKLNLKMRVDDNKILIEGQTDLKLSDYKINPPTFLLGTLTVWNEVTVFFKVAFEQQKFQKS